MIKWFVSKSVCPNSDIQPRLQKTDMVFVTLKENSYWSLQCCQLDYSLLCFCLELSSLIYSPFFLLKLAKSKTQNIIQLSQRSAKGPMINYVTDMEETSINDNKLEPVFWCKLKKCVFAKFYTNILAFSPFFSFWTKNNDQAYYDQHLECSATKRWSKYSTIRLTFPS